MPKKEDLIQKLCRKPIPGNFSKSELDILIWRVIERCVYMNSMLEYNGYHATVSYDADDELFVGEVFGVTDYFRVTQTNCDIGSTAENFIKSVCG